MRSFLKICFGIIFLFSFDIVFAFGVSLPYTMQRPLEISPGETEIFYLNLQNRIGNEDYSVKIDILNGGEIASFVEKKEFYKVPLGTEDFLIPIQVTASKNERMESQREVSFKISRVTESNDEGMVILEGGMTIKMAVLFVSETEETGSTERFNFAPIFIGFFSLLLVLILAITLKKKRKLKIRYKIHKRNS